MANGQAAPVAEAAKKSNAMMFGGIGALVVAAGIGVFVIKDMGKKKETGSNSPPPTAAPTTAPTTTAAGKPADPNKKPPVQELNKPLGATGSSTTDASTVDAALDLLDTNAESDTSSVGAGRILDKVQAMSDQLKTADQRVHGALIEMLAQGVLDPTGKKGCDALHRVEKDVPNAKQTRRSDFNTALRGCPSTEPKVSILNAR
jgi:hypothetical protein